LTEKGKKRARRVKEGKKEAKDPKIRATPIGGLTDTTVIV
jgi:hypothetical protein